MYLLDTLKIHVKLRPHPKIGKCHFGGENRDLDDFSHPPSLNEFGENGGNATKGANGRGPGTKLLYGKYKRSKIAFAVKCIAFSLAPWGKIVGSSRAVSNNMSVIYRRLHPRVPDPLEKTQKG